MTDASVRSLAAGPPLPGDWHPVGAGESGDRVYRRCAGAAFAKLSSGHGVTSLAAEREHAQWLRRQGIGAPAVLDWIVNDDTACLVTGPVAGVPASALDARQLSQAWPSMAETIKTLHDLPAATCPFDRGLAASFARAADVVMRDAVNPDFLSPVDRDQPPSAILDALRLELPLRLDQEKRDRVVCHGDACMPNIMVDPDTMRCTGLIDLGRLGTADRYVDLTLLIANAAEQWDTQAQARAAFERLFTVVGIADPDHARLAFYLRLDPLTWG